MKTKEEIKKKVETRLDKFDSDIKNPELDQFNKADILWEKLIKDLTHSHIELAVGVLEEILGYNTRYLEATENNRDAYFQGSKETTESNIKYLRDQIASLKQELTKE